MFTLFEDIFFGQNRRLIRELAELVNSGEDIDRALDQYNSLISVTDNNENKTLILCGGDVYYSKAIISERDAKFALYEIAIEAYSKFLDVHEDSDGDFETEREALVRAEYRVAFMRNEMGDCSRNTRCALNKQLALSPNSENYLYISAQTYVREGANEEALGQLSVIVEAEPDNYIVCLEKALLLKAMNYVEEANDTFSALVDRYKAQVKIQHLRNRDHATFIGNGLEDDQDSARDYCIALISEQILGTIKPVENDELLFGSVGSPSCAHSLSNLEQFCYFYNLFLLAEQGDGSSLDFFNGQYKELTEQTSSPIISIFVRTLGNRLKILNDRFALKQAFVDSDYEKIIELHNSNVDYTREEKIIFATGFLSRFAFHGVSIQMVYLQLARKYLQDALSEQVTADITDKLENVDKLLIKLNPRKRSANDGLTNTDEGEDEDAGEIVQNKRNRQTKFYGESMASSSAGNVRDAEGELTEVSTVTAATAAAAATAGDDGGSADSVPVLSQNPEDNTSKTTVINIRM